jgi:hypothetical protein
LVFFLLKNKSSTSIFGCSFFYSSFLCFLGFSDLESVLLEDSLLTLDSFLGSYFGLVLGRKSARSSLEIPTNFTSGFKTFGFSFLFD